MLYFGIILLAASLWVIVDSQRRYGKASVLMAGLLPISLGLTGFIYAVYRAKKQPGPDAPYPAKGDWRVLVGASMALFVAGPLIAGTILEQQKEAEKLAAQQEHRERVSEIKGIKDPYERAMARKEMKLPYADDLKQVPKGHPSYAIAQAELSASSRRGRAELLKQRRLADKSRVPRYEVVEIKKVEYEKFQGEPAKHVTIRVVIHERPITATAIEKVARDALAQRYELPVLSMQIHDTVANASNADNLDSQSDAARKRYRAGLVGTYSIGNGELNVMPAGVMDPNQKSVKL